LKSKEAWQSGLLR